MSTNTDALRQKFVEILSPAIDARAPYAKHMIDALVAAAEPRPISEAAWLIEVDGPRYLSLDPNVPGFWTADHMLATRFGRRVDAENYLSSQDTLDPNIPKIVEHLWLAHPPATGETR